MKNRYRELRERQQAEFNKFPIKYAFTDDQLKRSLVELGLKETDNDKDLRTPSPEPIYDPRSGQRLNTRELRNKEKFLKQKNLLITELIKYDENYKPPQGYKPPKKTHKIYNRRTYRRRSITWA